MLVHFLRHGESVSNAARGRDLPDAEGDFLTQLGRDQAELAARNLGDLGLTRLWASPMRRAQQTAAPIAAELGLEIETREDLRELREADGHARLEPGEQRGRRWSEWMADHGDDPRFAPPGADSFADTYARVERVKSQLLEHPDERILAISHGIFLRFFFVHSFLGDAFQPAETRRLWQLRTLNCSLSAFEHRSLVEARSAAYPAPGEWRCVTWMSRPWDLPAP